MCCGYFGRVVLGTRVLRGGILLLAVNLVSSVRQGCVRPRALAQLSGGAPPAALRVAIKASRAAILSGVADAGG